jgi:hypothetical protein
MHKKMMMLAGVALAAIAFAVPASASAEWTDDGASFSGSVTDVLTGKISFGNPAAGQTKFGCQAEADFDVFGGTTTGELTSFVPNTATCEGEGAFAECQLESDSTTIPADTTLHLVGAEKITLTTPLGEPIVIHNVYKSPCPIEKTTLTVEDLTLTTNGRTDLTDVTIEGTGLSHTTTRSPTVESTATVAVFGTMHTETDTITFDYLG